MTTIAEHDIEAWEGEGGAASAPRGVRATSLVMTRAIAVPDGIGGARRSLASKLAQSTRDHRMWWIRLLYALTIILVLAVVARLY